MELESGHLDLAVGEEIVLHLLRDLELALHALLLALLLEQSLERLRHGVERGGECAELVAAVDLDAMREVAAVDGNGGAIEVADGIGDGAVEADRHDEGEELDDSKDHGQGDEAVPDEGADEDGCTEEVRVEQRGPGGDTQQAGKLLATCPRGGGKRRGKSDAPIEQKGAGRSEFAAVHGA